MNVAALTNIACRSGSDAAVTTNNNRQRDYSENQTLVKMMLGLEDLDNGNQEEMLLPARRERVDLEGARGQQGIKFYGKVFLSNC